MNKIKVEIEFPKESYELASAVGHVLKSLGFALEDGYQSADLASLLTSAFAEFPKAIDGIKLIDDEAKEDAAGVTNAMIVPLVEGIDHLIRGIKKGKEKSTIPATA